jgi:hypothetical protein
MDEFGYNEIISGKIFLIAEISDSGIVNKEILFFMSRISF